MVDFYKTPEKLTVLGGKIHKGVLLVGPPGTVKTLLAIAVAGEGNVCFICLSVFDFVSNNVTSSKKQKKSSLYHL